MLRPLGRVEAADVDAMVVETAEPALAPPTMCERSAAMTSMPLRRASRSVRVLLGARGHHRMKTRHGK